ncbi:ABC transporter permease subunit [Agromyces cerinus subsp. nitratus]|uniref:ABC transporter permease subunit n=1 Tax=Agromyces cerinus TaxID=33878 RepID=UPI00362AAFF9
MIAAILWAFLYLPGTSPFVAALANVGIDVDFLSSDVVLWSIANIVTWTWTGYNMLVIYSALTGIPQELYEAAAIDGAGAWRIAWSIKIPLVAPALVLTTFFSIVGTVQLYAEPTVLKSYSSAITSGTRRTWRCRTSPSGSTTTGSPRPWPCSWPSGPSSCRSDSCAWRTSSPHGGRRLMPRFTSRLFIRGVPLPRSRVLPDPHLVAPHRIHPNRARSCSPPSALVRRGLRLLDNIVAVLTRQDGLFVRWMLNSLIYAGGGAIVPHSSAPLPDTCSRSTASPARAPLFGAILASILLPASLLVSCRSTCCSRPRG